MIFAYIYTLVSWGQISEKQGENVKEHVLIISTSASLLQLLLLDNLNVIPRVQ